MNPLAARRRRVPFRQGIDDLHRRVIDNGVKSSQQ
jgi:hypothetical protein